MLVHGFCFFKLVFIGPKELKLTTIVCSERMHADSESIIFSLCTQANLSGHFLVGAPTRASLGSSVGTTLRAVPLLSIILFLFLLH